MTDAPTAWLLFGAQLLTVIAILAILHRPVGDYLAHVFTSTRDLRIERGFYRLIGVDPGSAQSWPAYLRSVLALSVVGILAVYGVQRLQPFLPLALGLPATSEHLAFNTAVSFVTNTNWQSRDPRDAAHRGLGAAVHVRHRLPAALSLAAAQEARARALRSALSRHGGGDGLPLRAGRLGRPTLTWVEATPSGSLTRSDRAC